MFVLISQEVAKMFVFRLFGILFWSMNMFYSETCFNAVTQPCFSETLARPELTRRMFIVRKRC
jgi:hypothetical protein